MAQDRRSFMNNYLPIFITFSLTLMITLAGNWLFLRDTVLSNTADNLKYHKVVDANSSEIEQLQVDVVRLKEGQVYSSSDVKDMRSLLRQNLDIMSEVKVTLESGAAATNARLESIDKRLTRAGI